MRAATVAHSHMHLADCNRRSKGCVYSAASIIDCMMTPLGLAMRTLFTAGDVLDLRRKQYISNKAFIGAVGDCVVAMLRCRTMLQQMADAEHGSLMLLSRSRIACSKNVKITSVVTDADNTYYRPHVATRLPFVNVTTSERIIM